MLKRRVTLLSERYAMDCKELTNCDKNFFFLKAINHGKNIYENNRLSTKLDSQSLLY